MLKWKSADDDGIKNVVLAIEPENADEFLKQLRTMFKDEKYSFEAISSSEQLRALRTPDVLVLSYFLPGEKPTEILKYLAENMKRTHIVLLPGEDKEESRQYIRFARNLGFKNIVTGDLPGDDPYTIDVAIQHPLSEVKGQNRQKSILIASTANKGGVGKTTTAIALAEVLSQKVSTVLCDFDFAAPDIGSFYGLGSSRNYFETVVSPAKVNDNLYVLPVPDDIIPTTIKDKDISKIIDELSGFQIIIADTPPSPWEKPYLHELLSQCDIVYSIVDQSLFSIDETKKYAPTLLAMGVTPEKIRIILNRFGPKNASIDTVEQAFCSGFKKHVVLPKVIATIPEDWESQIKAAYQGKVLNIDIWGNVCAEIYSMLGIEYTPSPHPKRLFDIFLRKK